MEKLRKSASFRREEGLFPVEGIRMVREIPKDRLVQLFYTEKAYEKYGEEIDHIVDDDKAAVSEYFNDAMADNTMPQLVSDACMKKMSDTETPQGILAAVKMKYFSLEDILTVGEDENAAANKREADNKNHDDHTAGCNEPLILILEKLQDPGNLGTIIRSSEAAGVTGIIVSRDCADIYNPKTIRSTMGALFRMKMYISDDLPSDIEILKERGVKVYAMHLSGSEFYEKDFTKATAFLIGNEGNGLSPEVSAAADELMRIPMMGKVESLNAAISATVVSYEALRQRR